MDMLVVLTWTFVVLLTGALAYAVALGYGFI